MSARNVINYDIAQISPRARESHYYYGIQPSGFNTIHCAIARLRMLSKANSIQLVCVCTCVCDIMSSFEAEYWRPHGKHKHTNSIVFALMPLLHSILYADGELVSMSKSDPTSECMPCVADGSLRARRLTKVHCIIQPLRLRQARTLTDIVQLRCTYVLT